MRANYLARCAPIVVTMSRSPLLRGAAPQLISTMDSNCSISQWLGGLKDGDRAAIDQLWQRYAQRLVELARQAMRRAPKTGADEEDVAQSVFRNICRGAEKGKLQSITNRDELWWLLIVITKQKVVDHIRRETAQCRGGGRVVCETDLRTVLAAPGQALTAAIGEEPTPEFVVMFEEQTQWLLGLLRDDVLRRVALLRIEGYSVEEIAVIIGISARSIERKLQLIRRVWARQLSPE
jgi:RNA polymerase sigma factor (sigma-70 family)